MKETCLYMMVVLHLLLYLGFWARKCCVVICIKTANTTKVAQSVFITMPNTYDGTYLGKQVRARSFNCFRKKNSITYVWEGSNYASLAVSFWCIAKKVTWRYRISVLYQKATQTQAFPCKNFNSAFFYRTTPVAAF